MARKNPLGKIKDAAFDTLKHPVGTAEKAVGQAGRTAAVGRMVAGQVARTAVEKASEGMLEWIPKEILEQEEERMKKSQETVDHTKKA